MSDSMETRFVSSKPYSCISFDVLEIGDTVVFTSFNSTLNIREARKYLSLQAAKKDVIKVKKSIKKAFNQDAKFLIVNVIKD
jgi:hypothetical protein